MGLPGILGHELSLERVRAALLGDRVHHAYLFAGPDGVGKEKAALVLAQAMICEEADPIRRPCRTCGGCGKVEHGNHPDVVLALPQAEAVERGLISSADLDKAPSRELRVAEVRELERRIRMPPYEARHKVVILTPADKMNQSAQNALLKTLEEPPSATTLILVTAAADALLPTVRSRCARVAFGPLPVELVAAELVRRKGYDEATARVLATMAGGSLGAALGLDEETDEARRALISRLRGLDPAEGVALVGFAETFSGDRAVADRRLESIAVWYRDVLAAASGVDSSLLVNADLEDEIRADAERIPPRELVRRLAAIASARRDVAGNVNARLVVEGFLSGFAGEG